jgi:hypothetical protein
VWGCALAFVLGNLVYLVCLVCFVYLVYLVYSVCSVVRFIWFIQYKFMEFRKKTVVPERSLLDEAEQGGKHPPPGYPFNLLPLSLNLNLNLAGNPPYRNTVFVSSTSTLSVLIAYCLVLTAYS